MDLFFKETKLSEAVFIKTVIKSINESLIISKKESEISTYKENREPEKNELEASITGTTRTGGTRRNIKNTKGYPTLKSKEAYTNKNQTAEAYLKEILWAIKQEKKSQSKAKLSRSINSSKKNITLNFREAKKRILTS